jgi:hypothetical protein
MRKNGVVSAEWAVGYREKDPPVYLIKCIVGPVVEPVKEETAEEYKLRLEREKKAAEDALEILEYGAS